jgi:hypothetical protein
LSAPEQTDISYIPPATIDFYGAPEGMLSVAVSALDPEFQFFS